MQGMRTLLRNSLAKSLKTLPAQDRLAAALPVVCGSALAAHCVVTGLDERGLLHLGVSNENWLVPLLGMRDVLERDLAATAGVQLSGVDIQVLRSAKRESASGGREAERAGQSRRPQSAGGKGVVHGN